MYSGQGRNVWGSPWGLEEDGFGRIVALLCFGFPISWLPLSLLGW